MDTKNTINSPIPRSHPVPGNNDNASLIQVTGAEPKSKDVSTTTQYTNFPSLNERSMSAEIAPMAA